VYYCALWSAGQSAAVEWESNGQSARRGGACCHMMKGGFDADGACNNDRAGCWRIYVWEALVHTLLYVAGTTRSAPR
jgi:hypothetical protein